MAEEKKAPDKKLMIALGVIVLLVALLKIYSKMKGSGDETGQEYYEQAQAETAAPAAASEPATTGSRRNLNIPMEASAQNKTATNQNQNVKRTFKGFEKINSDFDKELSEKQKNAEIEVIQNVFQDFKKSLDQKNKAKVARLKADEAINTLLQTISKLKENYRKALEKYLETPKNFVELSDKYFNEGSYLEAESYANKAVNVCETLNMNTLEKLIRESITFKYRGMYDSNGKKIAIVLMIRNASGIIEGTSKQYLNLSESEEIIINETPMYRVVEIQPDRITLDNLMENKKQNIAFELSDLRKEN